MRVPLRYLLLPLLATSAAGLLAVRLRSAPDPPPRPVPPVRRPAALPYAPAGSRPDILLLTVDTLRQDHVGAYGYDRPTTPFVDALAQRGTRYTAAWSTSSWTVPAMASLLSGEWPGVHGLHQAGPRTQDVLHPALPSLPETLRALGYRTWAVTANGHLDARFGFARGFDRYADRGFSLHEDVRPVLLDFAAELQEGPPFFLWVHLFDPHGPYLRRPLFPDLAPDAGRRVFQEHDLIAAHAEGEVPPTMLAEVVAAYDSEIRLDDDLLAELFVALPRARDAFTVFTADHGEGFGEHGSFGHARTLYEELVRVPLVVVDPRASGPTVVEAPVSLIDVFPTLVAAAGGPIDPALPGVDLTADLTPERPVFLDVRRHDVLEGVVHDGWKLIRHVESPGAPMLFHLDSDRAERQDLASTAPAVVTRLERLLDDHVRRQQPVSAPRRVETTEERAAELEALGYAEP